MVEVIGLCGYYTMVSMTLNTFEFGLPEGEVSDLGVRLSETHGFRIAAVPVARILPTLKSQQGKTETSTCPTTHPSSPARGSGMSISRSPISIARSGFIAACSASRCMQRLGSGAAFISAGGYHHHIGLNTWESKGGHPPPPGTTGLFHTAILYPTRPALADALHRVMQAGIRLDGASDHGVSEALYLRDPDENGVELYRDRPRKNGRARRTARCRCSRSGWISRILLARPATNHDQHAPRSIPAPMQP